jgi:hypothetical protein
VRAVMPLPACYVCGRVGVFVSVELLGKPALGLPLLIPHPTASRPARRLRGSTAGPQQARLEAVVRPVMKALVGIAAGLHKAKHLQNLFVEVFEKVRVVPRVFH